MVNSSDLLFRVTSCQICRHMFVCAKKQFCDLDLPITSSGIEWIFICYVHVRQMYYKCSHFNLNTLLMFIKNINGLIQLLLRILKYENLPRLNGV